MWTEEDDRRKKEQIIQNYPIGSLIKIFDPELKYYYGEICLVVNYCREVKEFSLKTYSFNDKSYPIIYVDECEVLK